MGHIGDKLLVFLQVFIGVLALYALTVLGLCF